MLRVPAVVLDVVPAVAHAAADIDPGDPENMSACFAFELTHAAPHNDRANDVAPLNIPPMFVTLDTSHLEMSPLNNIDL